MLGADTTIGLLLTISFHKAALWGARLYGERYRPPYQEALPPDGSAAAAAAEPWYISLQLCGSYGALRSGGKEET